MADDKERVDWSALMDAHGIEPDADTRTPAALPDRSQAALPAPATRRSRLVHAIVAVTAVFSIGASVAVLIAILGGGENARQAKRAVADDVPVMPAGARPAAFEQTTDGVAVVPPPEAASALEPAVERPRPAAEKKRPARVEASEKAAEAEPAASAPADPNLPDEPDKEAVAAAMTGLEKDIAACAAPAGVSGEVAIKMRIEPDGSVAWASAKVQSSPFQACLDRLFKKARMPKSQKGATVRQTVALP